MEDVGGSRTVADVVELCVGIACLIAAAGTWRRPGLRVWAAILFVAGMAAALHAAIALLSIAFLSIALLLIALL